MFENNFFFFLNRQMRLKRWKVKLNPSKSPKIFMLTNSTLFPVDLLAAFDPDYHSLSFETLSSLGFHDNRHFLHSPSMLAASSWSLLLVPTIPPLNATLPRALLWDYIFNYIFSMSDHTCSHSFKCYLHTNDSYLHIYRPDFSHWIWDLYIQLSVFSTE